MIIYMLRLLVNISIMIYVFYLVIYYYRIGWYIEVLKLVVVCKLKFLKLYVMLNVIEDVDGYV